MAAARPTAAGTRRRALVVRQRGRSSSRAWTARKASGRTRAKVRTMATKGSEGWRRAIPKRKPAKRRAADSS
jgi:hypothetical protein